jgi:TetR/AcrR family transcriptional regulator
MLEMEKTGKRRGRTHDAQHAREAILEAAEEVFSTHGFDGARIDAIAKAAGYNKSLIFQYFGDKLGLYNEMIRRADKDTNEIQAKIISTLLEDEDVFHTSDFEELLRNFLRGYFDYMVQHPRISRIFMWELAEGWQTYAKIVSERDRQDIETFKPLADKVRRAGLLRSDFDPLAQIILVEFLFPSYLAILPLLQVLMEGEDFVSPESLAKAKEFLIEFVTNGLLSIPAGTTASQAAGASSEERPEV